ncbi:SPRY-domain-containing protein [Gigaspora margarita]|uniref:SPRY-domain-containing protein n=1 Tax=Gigaspora margarita TaxID=4874 RepID=A0A8H4EIY9_GIGMA|nr:SPRY-domain-containing protein [Gigaspora margarita]
MTNTTTTSNSVSSRSRAIPLNSAVAPHLAIMSSSSASPYPPLPATMTNPPPVVQYPTLSAGQASSTYLRSNINPVNAASTAHAIGSSTHSTYYNHPLASSSALPMNLSNSSTQLKSAPPKPKLPEYLANTSFAELYNKANVEKFSGDNNVADKDSLDYVALPTAWNVDDKCALLNVDSDRLRINYIGSGKADTDAAAIRANHPIPPQCGLFYFEVDIISKGKDGHIGIGFCAKTVLLNRLPGWENDSWGYHGDDGHSFCCSGTGKPYGPVFTTGDTIGCCINFRDGTAFYTKNGKHLGIAFRDLKGTLYPSIGMRTQGESVEVNFGHRKFKYAIEHYMKEEKARLWHVINATPMPPISSPLTSTPISQAASEANLTANAHQLILSYLIHHGFSETAKAFSRDAVRISQTYNNEMSEMEGVESENPSVDMDMDMLNRQKIRDAVLAGDIDYAITLTNSSYPGVLPSNVDILFQLRCRKFIEMIGACAGTKITLSDNEDVNIKGDNSHTMSDEDDTDDDEVVNESTEEDDDDDDEEDDEDEYKDAMDVDEFTAIISQSDCESDDEIDGPLTPHKKKRVPKRRKVTLGLHGLDDAMTAALKFGCELQDDYRNDDREEIRNALKDAFSLMAYDDPRVSCVAHLLDPSGREPVANALNSAILVSQGKPKIPSLEQVYRQASVVLHELSRNGVGSSAFVNVRKDCLI